MTDSHDMAHASSALWRRNDAKAAAFILAGLLILRLLAIAIDPHSLYADETQYWLWSQNFDWGYFSKPPMIAWIIALTTGLFGDADWAVRLAAPFLHTGTAIFVGLTTRRLFGDAAGAAAVILWLVMPAVWMSGTLITTDGPLVFCWSIGLYALARLRDGAGWTSSAVLGLAAGCAFLAKYAAIYFFIGCALALLLDGPARRALISLKGVLAGLLAAALIAPNLAWNAANDFATVSHTAANANWSGPLFNPGEMLSFIGEQFAVFGPVAFAVLVIAIVTAAQAFNRSDDARPRLLLAGFIVPALAIVALQAFISRAHANWAASAYVAGTILIAVFLTSGPGWRRWALYGSVGLHAVAGLAAMALAFSTPLSTALGVSDGFKRVREWPATAAALAVEAERAGVDVVVFDNRNDFHQMQRYGGAINAELFMWLRHGGAHNFAEATWPLPAGHAGSVLVVSERHHEIPVLRRDFARLERFGEIRIDHGGAERKGPRHYRLFIASGYQPVERTAEFEAEIAQAMAVHRETP
ncbi:MAG: glycosyltransferase family 39 protein [Pseudomonadota bacterium]